MIMVNIWNTLFWTFFKENMENEICIVINLIAQETSLFYIFHVYLIQFLFFEDGKNSLKI